jgi:hypothetical protein
MDLVRKKRSVDKTPPYILVRRLAVLKRLCEERGKGEVKGRSFKAISKAFRDMPTKEWLGLLVTSKEYDGWSTVLDEADRAAIKETGQDSCLPPRYERFAFHSSESFLPRWVFS